LTAHVSLSTRYTTADIVLEIGSMSASVEHMEEKMSVEIDQENLRMKFSALNIDFSSSSATMK